MYLRRYFVPVPRLYTDPDPGFSNMDPAPDPSKKTNFSKALKKLKNNCFLTEK